MQSGFQSGASHVEGPKRQQGKQEAESGQEPASSHDIRLQISAGPGQSRQQSVREEKDLTPLQRGPRDDRPDDPVSRDYEVVRSWAKQAARSAARQPAR